MRKLNAVNEREKKAYSIYLRNAKGCSESTIDKALAAILHFERSTKFKPFKKFHIQQAQDFKDYLNEAVTEKNKNPYSEATKDAILKAVKNFFLWLADRPGYKKVVRYSDVEYLNNNLKSARVAHAQREIPYPSLQACLRAFKAMPFDTEFEKRDKALFAFLMLTGIRVSAAASLRVKHINLEERKVIQDSREVNTKFSKHLETYFFPVEEIYLETLSQWLSFLKDEKLFGPVDALFPKAKVRLLETRGFGNLGLDREGYANGSQINKIISRAFQKVQLHDYTAHALRKTLATMMDEHCITMEERIAWSRNLGHENLATTVNSYMPMNQQRQGEVMKHLAT